MQAQSPPTSTTLPTLTNAGPLEANLSAAEPMEAPLTVGPPSVASLISGLPGQAEIEAADRRVRAWVFPTPGPLPIGSDSHRDASCRMFHDTFNPYKPSVIAWPKLEQEALQRLTSLPIWDIAVTTETKARARMLAYADSVDDPA